MGDALPAGSVITHYNTFIPEGCKVPWALRGGMRLLRKPSAFFGLPVMPIVEKAGMDGSFEAIGFASMLPPTG